MTTWPFDQPPNCAAITDVYVLEKNYPILKVIHYVEDDSWAFLSGETFSTNDGRIISMEEVIKIDNTLLSISTMKPGTIAYRLTMNGEWKIKQPN